MSATGRRPGARAPALLLLRHGESTWNADGRWQGHADPPLSDVGVEQARGAATGVAPFDAVWSSDLRRARETAQRFAPPGVPVTEEVRLRERDVGGWTGLTRDAIEDRHPGWLAAGHRPEGWEDDAAVAARAWDALRTVVAALDPGGRAVVVSHGGLIRAVEASLGVPPRPVPNLGGVWLHAVSGELVPGDRVALLDVAADASGTEPAVAAPE